MFVMGEFIGILIENVDPAAISANPHIALGVFVQRVNGIIAQAGIVNIVMPVVMEYLVFGIHQAQAAVLRSYPQFAIIVPADGQHYIMRQAIAFQRIVDKVAEISFQRP